MLYRNKTVSVQSQRGWRSPFIIFPGLLEEKLFQSFRVVLALCRRLNLGLWNKATGGKERFKCVDWVRSRNGLILVILSDDCSKLRKTEQIFTECDNEF